MGLAIVLSISLAGVDYLFGDRTLMTLSSGIVKHQVPGAGGTHSIHLTWRQKHVG